MAPILLAAGEHGIGYSHVQFVNEFQRICESHLSEKRAQAFALIFYSLGDGRVWEALSGADGFRILNQQSGREMTVFYLEASGVSSLSSSFNQTFMSQLGVAGQVEPPCIVFFRISDGEIEDISFADIDGRMPPHMIVEQLRRLIQDATGRFTAEGDLSGLNPMPIFKLVGALRSAASGV